MKNKYCNCSKNTIAIPKEQLAQAKGGYAYPDFCSKCGMLACLEDCPSNVGGIL